MLGAEEVGSGSRRQVDVVRIAIALSVVLGLAVRLVGLGHSVATLDRMFVPDDTYYTLAIARSLAHGDGPVAGAGIASGGFQPLIAFLLAPVFWFTNDPDTGLRADLVLLVLADLVTIGLLGHLGRRLGGPLAAVIAAATWALAPIAVRNALGGLEAALAVALEFGLIALWLRLHDRPSTRRAVAVGLVAGLAVLGRVDAVVLLVVLVGVDLVCGRARTLVPAGLGLVVVLAPWWIYSLVRFGTPLPTSGSAARALSPFAGFSNRVTSWAATSLVGGPYTSWWRWRQYPFLHPSFGAAFYWAFVGVLVVLAAVLVRSARRTGASAPTGIAAVSAFAAGLTLFYGWYAVVWYDHRYLLPVAAAVALLVAIGLDRLRRTGVVGAAVAVVTAVGLIAVAGVGVVAEVTDTARTPPVYDFLVGFRAPQGAVARMIPRGARVGAYQSGALSYFSGDDRAVFNLDGVVNPDAPPTRRPDATARYLRRHRVRWLADDELMLLPVVRAINAGAAPGLTIRSVRRRVAGTRLEVVELVGSP